MSADRIHVQLHDGTRLELADSSDLRTLSYNPPTIATFEHGYGLGNDLCQIPAGDIADEAPKAASLWARTEGGGNWHRCTLIAVESASCAEEREGRSGKVEILADRGIRWAHSVCDALTGVSDAVDRLDRALAEEPTLIGDLETFAAGCYGSIEEGIEDPLSSELEPLAWSASQALESLKMGGDDALEDVRTVFYPVENLAEGDKAAIRDHVSSLYALIEAVKGIAPIADKAAADLAFIRSEAAEAGRQARAALEMQKRRGDLGSVTEPLQKIDDIIAGTPLAPTPLELALDKVDAAPTDQRETPPATAKPAPVKICEMCEKAPAIGEYEAWRLCEACALYQFAVTPDKMFLYPVSPAPRETPPPATPAPRETPAPAPPVSRETPAAPAKPAPTPELKTGESTGLAAAKVVEASAAAATMPIPTVDTPAAPPAAFSLVLIGCGKSKAKTARPACSLYTGRLFKARAAHARALALRDACPWLILSAKHATLAPMDEVEPYDMHAKALKGEALEAWQAQVLEEISFYIQSDQVGEVLAGRRILLLAGAAYHKRIAQVLIDAGAEVCWPVEGMKGIANQAKWHAAQVEAIEAPAKAEAAHKIAKWIDKANADLDAPPVSRETPPAPIATPAPVQTPEVMPGKPETAADLTTSSTADPLPSSLVLPALSGPGLLDAADVDAQDAPAPAAKVKRKRKTNAEKRAESRAKVERMRTLDALDKVLLNLKSAARNEIRAAVSEGSHVAVKAAATQAQLDAWLTLARAAAAAQGAAATCERCNAAVDVGKPHGSAGNGRYLCELCAFGSAFGDDTSDLDLPAPQDAEQAPESETPAATPAPTTPEPPAASEAPLCCRCQYEIPSNSVPCISIPEALSVSHSEFYGPGKCHGLVCSECHAFVNGRTKEDPRATRGRAAHDERMADLDAHFDWHTECRPKTDGAYSYVIMIRGMYDPERTSRSDAQARGDSPLAWKLKISRPVEDWSAAILALAGDGQARTFNALCVEIADTTADVCGGTNAEDAVWSLTMAGLVRFTVESPILFRITDKGTTALNNPDVCMSCGERVPCACSVCARCGAQCQAATLTQVETVGKVCDPCNARLFKNKRAACAYAASEAGVERYKCKKHSGGGWIGVDERFLIFKLEGSKLWAVEPTLNEDRGPAPAPEQAKTAKDQIAQLRDLFRSIVPRRDLEILVIQHGWEHADQGSDLMRAIDSIESANASGDDLALGFALGSATQVAHYLARFDGERANAWEAVGLAIGHLYTAIKEERDAPEEE